MIIKRLSSERGRADHGWLDTRHSFSFGRYLDPAHMGLGPLRVLNDDRVVGGAGFGTHAHENMEIVSYVVSGALEHRDSMGTGSILRPGDVQRMTAGTGVTHSEFNPSPDESLRFLQIWILPESEGLEPGYEERNFPEAGRRGRMQLIVSPDGAEGSLKIHQDAQIFATLLDRGQELTHSLGSGRRAWVQVVRGRVSANGEELAEGDGLSLEEEPALTIAGRENAELLIFDLA